MTARRSLAPDVVTFNALFVSCAKLVETASHDLVLAREHMHAEDAAWAASASSKGGRVRRADRDAENDAVEQAAQQVEYAKKTALQLHCLMEETLCVETAPGSRGVSNGNTGTAHHATQKKTKAKTKTMEMEMVKKKKKKKEEEGREEGSHHHHRPAATNSTAHHNADPPNTITYNSLVAVFAECGDADRVRWVMKKMEAHKVVLLFSLPLFVYACPQLTLLQLSLSFSLVLSLSLCLPLKLTTSLSLSLSLFAPRLSPIKGRRACSSGQCSRLATPPARCLKCSTSGLLSSGIKAKGRSRPGLAMVVVVQETTVETVADWLAWTFITSAPACTGFTGTL